MARLNSEVKALYINGTQVPIKDGTFNFTNGGFERNPVMGGQRKLGSTNSAQAATCSFTVTFVAGTNLSIYDIEAGQIRVVWDRGDQMIMTNADLQTPVSGSAPEGDLTLEYNGDPWQQTVLAS